MLRGGSGSLILVFHLPVLYVKKRTLTVGDDIIFHAVVRYGEMRPHVECVTPCELVLVAKVVVLPCHGEIVILHSVKGTMPLCLSDSLPFRALVHRITICICCAHLSQIARCDAFYMRPHFAITNNSVKYDIITNSQRPFLYV
jgi:hypothetical protein